MSVQFLFNLIFLCWITELVCFFPKYQLMPLKERSIRKDKKCNSLCCPVMSPQSRFPSESPRFCWAAKTAIRSWLQRPYGAALKSGPERLNSRKSRRTWQTSGLVTWDFIYLFFTGKIILNILKALVSYNNFRFKSSLSTSILLLPFKFYLLCLSAL